MAEKLSDQLKWLSVQDIRIRPVECALLREAARIVKAVEDAPECEWTFDEFTDSWDTDCEAKFNFIAGGPEDNGVRYCHCCGKRVKLMEVDDGSG